jgi:hypothetical protein
MEKCRRSYRKRITFSLDTDEWLASRLSSALLPEKETSVPAGLEAMSAPESDRMLRIKENYNIYQVGKAGRFTHWAVATLQKCWTSFRNIIKCKTNNQTWRNRIGCFLIQFHQSRGNKCVRLEILFNLQKVELCLQNSIINLDILLFHINISFFSFYSHVCKLNCVSHFQSSIVLGKEK